MDDRRALGTTNKAKDSAQIFVAVFGNFQIKEEERVSGRVRGAIHGLEEVESEVGLEETASAKLSAEGDDDVRTKEELFDCYANSDCSD